MPESSTSEPFLTIDRGGNQAPLVFQTLDDFKTKFQSDAQLWSWLTGHADRSDPAGNAGKHLKNTSQAVKEKLSAYASGNEGNKPSPKAWLEQAARDFYLAGGLGFDASTPAAQFIKQIENTSGNDVAAYAFGFMLGNGRSERRRIATTGN